MPLELKHAFTLDVELAPPLEFGPTHCGERRFIPIVGGSVQGPSLCGKVLLGGGDWNAVRSDGVVHVFAKYNIQTEDGTIIQVTNEGYGRADQSTMKLVFGDNPAAGSIANCGQSWYTKTWPRFEVTAGKWGWLNSTCFIGDLLPPTEPNRVVIEVYEIL